ncbi:hypothetical protein BRC81_06565 [Halobacteriales archaeon QS_1_68_20]|nr:MAG: hypothetical protein BRC81_06565 [Halobacteriales archaeon QS_1_68_20]
MYVSHPVRAIRDDPVPGEEVRLLLRVDEDADPDRVADAASDAGATGEDRLEFGTLRIRVAHEDVTAVCELEGLAAVETARTLEMDLDGAGEDVEY